MRGPAPTSCGFGERPGLRSLPDDLGSWFAARSHGMRALSGEYRPRHPQLILSEPVLLSFREHITVPNDCLTTARDHRWGLIRLRMTEMWMLNSKLHCEFKRFKRGV